MVDATNISTSSTFIHLWGSQGLKCSPLALKKKTKTHCLTILRMIGANWHSRLWHAWPLMLHCTQVVSPNRKWKMYRYFFRVHGHYEPTSRYTFKHCLNRQADTPSNIACSFCNPGCQTSTHNAAIGPAGKRASARAGRGPVACQLARLPAWCF